MKNITVTLDDETYRKARIRAAELDTSVSTVVRFRRRSRPRLSAWASEPPSRNYVWEAALGFKGKGPLPGGLISHCSAYRCCILSASLTAGSVAEAARGKLES